MSDARTYSDLIPVSIGDISGVVYATQMSYDVYSNDLLFYKRSMGFRRCKNKRHI